MTSIKKSAITLFALASLAFPACGGGGFFPPDQSDVNFEFQDFIIQLEDLVDFLDFFGISNCAELQTLINDLVGTVSCDISGSSEIQITNFTCNDGPPVTASFNITEIDDNCEDDFDFSDGTVSGSVDFDGSLVNFNISSPGISTDDLTFVFSNFLVTINSSFTDTCAGTATVNGETCVAAPDCSACTLQ